MKKPLLTLSILLLFSGSVLASSVITSRGFSDQCDIDKLPNKYKTKTYLQCSGSSEEYIASADKSIKQVTREVEITDYDLYRDDSSLLAYEKECPGFKHPQTNMNPVKVEVVGMLRTLSSKDCSYSDSYYTCNRNEKESYNENSKLKYMINLFLYRKSGRLTYFEISNDPHISKDQELQCKKLSGENLF